MTDPTITCPKCNAKIKLAESLAAPMRESTPQHYEQRIARKGAEVSKREAGNLPLQTDRASRSVMRRDATPDINGANDCTTGRI